MKICFMGDGNSIHIKRWVSYFSNKRHDVYLITFSKCDIEGATVYEVGDFGINPNGGNWKYLFYVRQIRKIIKNIKPDIISAHYVTSYGLLAALSGFKRVVITAWGSDILVTAKKNTVYKLLTKFSLNRSKLITCESQYLNQTIMQYTKTNVITVPMGINRELCYKNRSLSQNQIKFVSLRALVPNSNIELIIKSFSRLITENKDRDLQLIIGNDGPLRKDIEKLIEELQIEKNVKIVGFLKNNVLEELLLTSNVHISIPTSDSTSVTLLQAMGSGILNIVSNIPANNEWIIDGVNGLTLEGFNEEKLKLCMERAIDDNETFKEGNIINRKTILEKAIWEDNMNVIEGFFYKTADTDYK